MSPRSAFSVISPSGLVRPACSIFTRLYPYTPQASDENSHSACSRFSPSTAPRQVPIRAGPHAPKHALLFHRFANDHLPIHHVSTAAIDCFSSYLPRGIHVRRASAIVILRNPRAIDLNNGCQRPQICSYRLRYPRRNKLSKLKRNARSASIRSRRHRNHSSPEHTRPREPCCLLPSGISCITRAFTTCPTLLFVRRKRTMQRHRNHSPSRNRNLHKREPAPEIRSNARGRKKLFMSSSSPEAASPKPITLRCISIISRCAKHGRRAHDSPVTALCSLRHSSRNSAFLAFRPCVILRMGHAPGNTEAK